MDDKMTMRFKKLFHCCYPMDDEEEGFAYQEQKDIEEDIEVAEDEKTMLRRIDKILANPVLPHADPITPKSCAVFGCLLKSFLIGFAFFLIIVNLVALSKRESRLETKIVESPNGELAPHFTVCPYGQVNLVSIEGTRMRLNPSSPWQDLNDTVTITEFDYLGSICWDVHFNKAIHLPSIDNEINFSFYAQIDPNWRSQGISYGFYEYYYGSKSEATIFYGEVERNTFGTLRRIQEQTTQEGKPTSECIDCFSRYLFSYASLPLPSSPSGLSYTSLTFRFQDKYYDNFVLVYASGDPIAIFSMLFISISAPLSFLQVYDWCFPKIADTPRKFALAVVTTEDIKNVTKIMKSKGKGKEPLREKSVQI